jgi:transposase
MRKQYTPEMKAQIVLEILKEEKSLSELASEHDMHPNQLSRWKREALENFHQLFTDGNKDTGVVKSRHRLTKLVPVEKLETVSYLCKPPRDVK